MKTLIRKDFVFIYLDKDGNELDRKVKRNFTNDDAYKYARGLLAESLINDLDEIEVKEL